MMPIRSGVRGGRLGALIATCTFVVWPSLLARPAIAAEPTTMTIAPFIEVRDQLGRALDRLRQRCEGQAPHGARVALRFAIHVDAEGRVGGVGPVAPPGPVLPSTIELGLRREGTSPTADAVTQEKMRCLEQGLGALTVAAPLGGRGLTLRFRVVLGEATGAGEPQLAVGVPQFDPLRRDTPEFQRRVAAVIWKGEPAALACLGSASRGRPLQLRWVLDPRGLVIHVAPPAGLLPDETACLVQVVRRWKFPPTPDDSSTWALEHTFNAGPVAPLDE